jgi:hypothetical protein
VITDQTSHSDFEMAEILPYLFEPVRQADDAVPDPIVDGSDSDNSDDGDEVVDAWKLGNTHWCVCNKCVPKLKIPECVCCGTMTNILHMLNGITCITEHEDFHTVCLHRGVLRTGLLARNDIRQGDLREPLSNR